jgi:hypothetical protein
VEVKPNQDMLQTRNRKEVVEFAISIASRPSSLNYYFFSCEREEEVQKRRGEKHSHGRSLPKEQHQDPAQILYTFFLVT